MSDNKRTFETIQTEYEQLALRAGHTQYQVYALTKDLGVLNDQMRDLNFEGARIKAEDAKAKKEGK